MNLQPVIAQLNEQVAELNKAIVSRNNLLNASNGEESAHRTSVIAQQYRDSDLRSSVQQALVILESIQSIS